jgi:DNA-binding CsgD family transcriptional regulator
VLDSLGRAALVASPRSDGAHQTPALRALLDQEPEQTAVLLEITAVADALAMPGGSADGTGQGAPLPMVRDVVTAQARYQLRGAQLTTESERPTMVVTVDRLNPMPPSDGQLHARFGLTPRESEVARQLAVGHTNAELSAALGISRHTGERHTERVLGKLGLHSRAAVAAALGAA